VSTTQELREAIKDKAEHIVITDHLDLCDGLGFLCDMLAIKGDDSRTKSIRVRSFPVCILLVFCIQLCQADVHEQ
jgi:hypothetical protein